jgi:hypothetical protein
MLRTMLARTSRPALAATIASAAFMAAVLAWHLIDRWSCAGMRFVKDRDGITIVVGPPATEFPISPMSVQGGRDDDRSSPPPVRH